MERGSGVRRHDDHCRRYDAEVIFAEIFGPDALVVIVLAVVLLFGVNRLPQLARSLGEAAKELRHNESDTDPARDDGESDGSDRDADTVTLTKAELDALLAEREAKVIREGGQAETPTD
jgi:sec-independent protein translocase protein TatA